MKKILVSFLLLLFVFHAFSQETPEPKTETDIDKTREVIQAGRNEMVQKILSGNQKEAIKTLNKLRNTVDDQFVILYPREEILVALATNRFQLLVDSARHYNSMMTAKTKALVYDDFRDALYRYMLPELVTISGDLENSSLTEDEKEIIRIYLKFLFTDDIPVITKSINRFERKHPKTEFKDFLNSLKRFTINGRINFSVGYSSECIGGKVSGDYFDQLNNIKIEMDGFIRKTYFSLYIGGGFSNTSSDYVIRDENGELTNVDGEEVSSQKYGFKLGRILYSSNTVKLYPYISVGGHEITSLRLALETTDADKPTEVLKGSFFAGAGASCDIILKRWKPHHMYDPEGYFFIRPNLGYDRFLTRNDISNRNNFYFSVSLGVSIGPKL